MQTPILFLIFNRPKETQRVFDEIARQKPSKLYIAADGPRTANITDISNCEKVLEVVSNISWECEVKKLYRSENLGCKDAVSGAIDWFFEHEEYGIILEDDCLPHPKFFEYCSNSLEKYKYDYTVMHVNGYNPIESRQETRFSNYISIWGWATWRRAWNLYSKNAVYYESFRKQNLLNDIFPKSKYLIEPFIDEVVKGKYNTWDLQWSLAIHVFFGKSILPSENLIQNIGFDGNSTHTNSSDLEKLGKKFSEKTQPIQLPERNDIEASKDDEIIKYFNGKLSLLKGLIYLKYKLKSARE